MIVVEKRDEHMGTQESRPDDCRGSHRPPQPARDRRPQRPAFTEHLIAQPLLTNHARRAQVPSTKRLKMARERTVPAQFLEIHHFFLSSAGSAGLETVNFAAAQTSLSAGANGSITPLAESQENNNRKRPPRKERPHGKRILQRMLALSVA